MSNGTIEDTPAAGSFTDIAVRTGPGGGLATQPLRTQPTTHYHAARLEGVGDVVLAVTRAFDERSGAARRLELRAFSAAAPGRGALASMAPEQLLAAPGAIAFVLLVLAAAGEAADERRPAELVRCVVTDAAPTAAAARGIADWLRTTWEAELAFGSWPAVRGTLEAFTPPTGGAVADWAREWLVAGEHHVDASAEGRFLKVLSDAWLEPIADATSPDSDR